MLRVKLIIIGWLLLCVTAPLAAQDTDADWEVLLYDGQEILVYTAEGISETITLPELAVNIGFMSNVDMRLSPDRRYLVFGDNDIWSPEDDRGYVVFYIADLHTGTCCVIVDDPLVREGQLFNIGAFSPDGTQIVASIAQTPYGLPEGETPSAGLVVIDLASGDIVHEIDPRDLFDDSWNIAEIVDWTDEGIILDPFCFPCEGTLSGQSWRWQPETGEGEKLDRFYNIPYGDLLPLTGEVLYAASNNDYAFVLDYVYNVVHYLPHGRASETPQTVYHNQRLDIVAPQPYWVWDGRAYFVYYGGDKGLVIHRDGTIDELSFEQGQHFLAGTPDGWLMWSNDSAGVAELSYYHQDAGGSWVSEITPLPGSFAVWVVSTPPLGAEVVGQPLQAISP